MSSQFNDTEDDTPLYTRRAGAAEAMGSDRRAEEVQARHPEREVTLNTGIVLALFFALALLCAVFFGFGYSIGHKSVPQPIVADADPTPTDTSTKVVPKPAPGQPAPQPVPEYVPSAGADRAAAKAAAVPVTPPSVRATAADAAPTHSAATPVRTPTATGAASPVAVPAVAAGPAAAGSIVVQIAAVSHQEDADVLLSALRRRGYAVLTRSEPADKLIHVQIGPFSNRKEAEAMRQKLAGDGYNAFIK